MILRQHEIIRLFRRRAKLSQEKMGIKAFNKGVEHGRSKISHIESGRLKPSSADLRDIARVLEVRLYELMPDQTQYQKTFSGDEKTECWKTAVLDCLAEVESYLALLNHAISLNDLASLQLTATRLSHMFACIARLCHKSEGA